MAKVVIPNEENKKRKWSTVKLNQETAISNLIDKHGDRYDYSKAVYSKSKDPIEIGCSVHGYFFQKYSIHARGAHCWKCINAEKTLTDSQYIERCKENQVLFENTDYSLMSYVKMSSKIRLRCKVHDVEYVQLAQRHMNGACGCKLCKSDNRTYLTEDDFLNRANLKHGQKYDYSKSVYLGWGKKLEIVCKSHGSFWQSPYMHTTNGHGCRKCTYEGIKLDQDTAVKNLRDKRGDRYDYSRVKYEGVRGKIIIGCRIHGFFKQTYNTHASRGTDCPKCAKISFSEKKKLSTDAFVKKAKDVHGCYDYSYEKTEYKGSSVKVCIYCKVCSNYFFQEANSHLQGAGCNCCVESSGERVIRRYLIGRFEFEAEKCFKEYKEVYRLRFDFWIPSLNLCIEFQGAQHYGVLTGDRFGGEKDFIKAQQRDQKKRDFCKKNNIELLEIPYWDFKNIESILDEKLKALAQVA